MARMVEEQSLDNKNTKRKKCAVSASNARAHEADTRSEEQALAECLTTTKEGSKSDIR